MTAFSRPASSATSERRALLVVAALLPSIAHAGWWHITGPCQTAATDSSCVVSPGFPHHEYGNSQDCTMRWMSETGTWYLHVASFNTETCCDKITVNGHEYSGTGGDLAASPQSLWGDVRWHSDHSVTHSGWKLCARQQTTPAAVWSVTGPCHVVSNERACVTSPNWPSNYGNSQSCTMRIANGRSMYLQVASFYTETNLDHLDWNGRRYSGGGGRISWSNAALWSSVSWTTDGSVTKKGWKICARERNDVYWNVAGPCATAPNEPHCVTSPNHPYNYNNNEACTMSVASGGWMYLYTPFFLTESSFDYLRVNGVRYSGDSSGLVGNSIRFLGDVEWVSDGSNTRAGWKICASTSASTTALEASVAATELVEEPATNKTAAAPQTEIEGLAELLASGASAEDAELMAKLKRTTAKSEMMEETVEMEETKEMEEKGEEEDRKETEMETEMEGHTKDTEMETEAETEEALASEIETEATSTITTTQTMLV